MRQILLDSSSWSAKYSTDMFRRSDANVSTATTELITTTSGFATVTRYTTMSQSTAADGKTSHFAVVIVSSVTPASSPVSVEGSSATSAVYAGPNIDSSTPNPQFKVEPFEMVVNGSVTLETYFQARYFVPVMAVFIKAYGEVIVTSLKLVEPFHRLSTGSGATSSSSLLSEYLSSSFSCRAMSALRERHLLTTWSVVMHVLLTVATPLATSAMVVKARDICMIDGVEFVCNPAWIINTIFIRTVEGILVVCLVLVLILIFSTWHYYINLSRNPSSIAAILSILNSKPCLYELQQIDPKVQNKAFEKALSGYKFWLGHHEKSYTRLKTHGIVAYKTASQSGGQTLLATFTEHDRALQPMPAFDPLPLFDLTSDSSSQTSRFWTDSLHIFTTIALLTFIFAYYFDNHNDVYNGFFSSETIYPRLLLVSMAVIVDVQVKGIERVVRITEPYRRLSLSNSLPETTISLTLNGTCWSNLLHCIYNLVRYNRDSHMLWQTIVTIVACLSDLNIIFVSYVPQDPATIWQSYLVCTYESIVITSCILLVVLNTMLWWRNTAVVKNMPRRPNTIGAVCAYLCGSEMVTEVNEIYGGDVSLMLSARRHYTFRKMVGTDWKVRWCVDFAREEKEGEGDRGAGD